MLLCIVIKMKMTLTHLKKAIAKSPHAEHLSFEVDNPTGWSNEGAINLYLDPESKFAFNGERSNNVSPFYGHPKETKSRAIESAIEDLKGIEPMDDWLAEEHGILLEDK